MINTTIGITIFDKIFFKDFTVTNQIATRFSKDSEASRFYYERESHGDSGHQLICMYNASQAERERLIEESIADKCTCQHDCCGHWFTRYGVVSNKFGYRYVRLSRAMNV